MNCFDAYPDPIPGGYRIMLRFAEDGQPEPLLIKGGQPAIFNTKAEAWEACTASLLRYFNGSLTSTGHKITSAKSEAEAIFKNGRRIPVETNRRSA